MRTGVQRLSTHRKPDVAVCVCSPNSPVARWEAEAEESLDTLGPAGRAHEAVKKSLSLKGGRETSMPEVVL